LLKRSGRLYDDLMVELEGPSNENGRAWIDGNASDAAYVRDYLAKAMAHFRECDIHFSVVVRELLGSLIRYAPGDPYAKLSDEGDIQSGLSCLIPAAEDLKRRVEAYWKASRRNWDDSVSKLAAELDCDREQAFRIWWERQYGED
jgi:hypothetical protein